MRLGVIVLSTLLVCSQVARADDGDRFDPANMVAQVGGGLAGGVAGVGIGGAIGLVVALVAANDTKDWGKPLLVLVAASAGLIVGTDIGVKWTGDHYGGTGGWAGTSLGLVGGIAITGLGAYAIDAADLDPDVRIAGLVSAVVGYQLTNDGPARDDARVFQLPALAF